MKKKMKEIKLRLKRKTDAVDADKEKTTFIFIPVLDSLQKEMQLKISTESADMTMDDLGLPMEIGDEVTIRILMVNSQQKLDDSHLLAGVKSRKDLETHRAPSIMDEIQANEEALSKNLSSNGVDVSIKVTKEKKKRGRPRK